MATMQQPGAEDRVGARLDRRDVRLVVVALAIVAAAIGAAVVFTQSRGQKTTRAGVTETLRFSSVPQPIAAGTDALWVGINPAYALDLQSGQDFHTQKFGSLERVNLTTGAIEQTLRIPGFVGPALHLGSVLWVGRNSGPMFTNPGELDKLDWNTCKRLGRLPLDRGVSALTYGDGSMWVTVGASPATLLRVNPTTLRAVGEPIVVTPRNAFATAFGSEAVWETGFDDGSLARVDPATGRIDRTQLGGSAAGVVDSGGSIWVALRDRGTVVRVDPRTLRVLHTTTVGTDPTHLAAAGGLIWVTNQSEGTVTRLDARTGQTTGLPIRITPDNAGDLTTAGSGRTIRPQRAQVPASGGELARSLSGNLRPGLSGVGPLERGAQPPSLTRRAHGSA